MPNSHVNIAASGRERCDCIVSRIAHLDEGLKLTWVRAAELAAHAARARVDRRCVVCGVETKSGSMYGGNTKSDAMGMTSKTM